MNRIPASPRQPVFRNLLWIIGFWVRENWRKYRNKELTSKNTYSTSRREHKRPASVTEKTLDTFIIVQREKEKLEIKKQSMEVETERFQVEK